MAHAFTNFLYHLVWSTKNREPLIKKELKPRLNSYLRTTIKNEGANLFINGIEDHIHLLVAMPATMQFLIWFRKLNPHRQNGFEKHFQKQKIFPGKRVMADSVLQNRFYLL